MNHTIHISQLRKRITIANVINSIFLAMVCLLEITAGVSVKYCQETITSLVDSAGSADPESYMGGYQVVSGVFGAGAMAIVVGILYLLIGITFLYLVAFVIENIHGYRLVSKLKKEAYSQVLMRKTRRNAIFKLVLALLVILPTIYVAYTIEASGLLLLIIPQAAVLVLAIDIIRILPESIDRLQPHPPLGEEP